jgi:FkbM family methyltransferase
MVLGKSKTPFPALLVISIVILLLVHTIYFNTIGLLIANPTSAFGDNHRKTEQETSDNVKKHSDNDTPLSQQQQQQQHRTSKLGDDCYHIFLDVGANVGVHSRFLMEPQSYPRGRNIAKRHFNSVYGRQRDNRDFCMFAFEPNPVHKQRHEALAQAYEQMGWRYHYIEAGVSDQDGNLTFYHMNNNTHNEWGFSNVQGKCKRGQECRAEIVPVIRLASWIDEHVNQRKLPEVVHGKFEEGPKVGTYFLIH